MWVGVKARKWLSGRDVARNEWYIADPNGEPDDCAFLSVYYKDSNRMPTLVDEDCEKRYSFLCMRKAA